ncbi:hypothetical protein AX14_014179 [Amanita brunnescens Koide BX004]|nr:hypothetical protein AX14_014179 [Amanita brunnescens Koide BX004]
MVLFPGCNREFSTSGFITHVHHTTTAVCRAVYHNIFTPSDHVGDNDIDMEHTGSENFEGDYFGNYEQADFSWLEDDETNARADENEEESEKGDEDDTNDPGIDLEQTSHTLHPPRAPPLVEALAQSLTENYIIEPFPGDKAGAPLKQATASQSNFEKYWQQLNSDAEYAPFASCIDWEIARWAKIHGLTSNAVTELLKIDGIVDKLGLSYKNACELNKIIDEKLPNRQPRFQRHDLKIGSEMATIYYRDVLQCIQALYSSHEFATQLIHKPERHYQQLGDEKCRVFHDMHTGTWWWEVQATLEARKPGATVIPVIISTDRTQVMLFGNKTAYLIYLTIGNLPKSIRCKPSRQGQILLAYLPTSKLKFITNKAARRRMLINIYHASVLVIKGLIRPQFVLKALNVSNGLILRVF